MNLIGLTGGVACGKSSVARILRDQKHVPVVDADDVSRTILTPGTPCYKQVVQHFGAQILQANGQIDRSALRQLITRSKRERTFLEGVTHPAIREKIAETVMHWASQGHSNGVVEAALLVETGSWKQYSALIVVSCRAETQLARLMRRDDQSQSDAQRLIDAQYPLEEKEKVATVVIQNDGSLEELELATLSAWETLQTRFSEAPGPPSN